MVAVAVIRRGDEVLLVRQQGPEQSEPHWALPGGLVESGELLLDALAREVKEETGLRSRSLDESPGWARQISMTPSGVASRLWSPSRCQRSRVSLSVMTRTAQSKSLSMCRSPRPSIAWDGHHCRSAPR